MWLCEDKLKGKTAHFRLPSGSQKGACLSSLISINHNTPKIDLRVGKAREQIIKPLI